LFRQVQSELPGGDASIALIEDRMLKHQSRVYKRQSCGLSGFRVFVRCSQFVVRSDILRDFAVIVAVILP